MIAARWSARDVGLVTVAAALPLYGTFAAFDPQRPPIPPLVPAPVTVALMLVTLVAYALVMPAALRRARRDWVTFAYTAPGFGTIAAGLCGFDPLTGVGLGVAILGFGLAGLALDGAGAAAARRVTHAFLWSALIASSFAVVLWLLHRPGAIFAYNNGRAIGTFLNPNELAAYTLLGLGIAMPIALRSRGRDVLAVSASAALAAALAATFSRWGLLSAVLGLAAYALMRGSRRLLAAAVLVAVAGVGINAFAGGGHHSPRDDEARVVAWRAGLTAVERFPLTGVGPLAYGLVYPEVRPPDGPGPRTAVAFDPHSLPLSYAASGGLLSLATLIAIAVILQIRVQRAGMFGIGAGLIALDIDVSINTISIFLPLLFQGAALAYATARNNDHA